jgi:glycosyltransferase involved in cell wall biosynthesis
VGNFLSSKEGNRSVGEDLAEHLKCLGYLVITTSNKRSRIARLIDMVFTIWMRRSDYQVAYVEVYSGLAFVWAEIVCQLLDTLRKPYILALHGGNLPIFARRWPARVKRLLSGAVAVTSPSNYLQEEICLYRENIVLIPNPLDVKSYRFRLRSTPTAHLVWLRAFHHVYNPHMVPLFMAELRETFPEITLTMIGPDKGDGALQKTQNQIKKLGLQHHIDIVLGIPKVQVPKRLEQGDIFINTTSVDNTPVSVMEAMACGLCIVSTRVGGIPYLLEDEKDALLVPPNDQQAISAAVERILNDSGLAERLSRNARNKAEGFDWSVILQKWEALFKEVLNTDRKTDNHIAEVV